MKPQIVMDVVARDMGAEFSAFERVSEGEDSQAFAVRIDDVGCIIRVNRSAKGFLKDNYCYRHFTSSELPIPEIIRIGDLDDEFSYCISRRAPGITLQDVQSSELTAIAPSVMKVMEAMGSTSAAETSGYGSFDENGIGRFLSWRDYIVSISDPRCYDWEPLILHPNLVNERLSSYFEVIEAFAPRCPDVRRLVHGDFGSNNVLTDGGIITGVIDWSEAMLGDPLYDVANIFFWRTWLECMEAQASYIEERHPEITERGRAEALRCYQLRIGLDVIYQSAAAGDADTVVLEWALARCDQIISS
ncbi:hygromycin-B 4-O-kinase [Paenibacillus taihuensis]|uniref:Hygromycin-B 4-O-kinase n=1 Tax=Paenibacillus taihuensis TaxID=1156355 RepID=A0A3D9SGT7_9BACL|nr:aminoglycoside phosphotransferase family protein [Paenibacillus taihuensis]REE88992.1 hygromycin-B 4-O-kinase [Paenibacillus taihuensis]